MILPHHGKWPYIHETAFVAPSADIIGEVQIGEDSSIWFQVVIRADVGSVSIGKRSNIQDHSMLHLTRGKNPLIIGDDVTVGHRATLHGCKIGNRVLIGMGAILLDDAEIGEDCIIGAGALITQGIKIPPGSMVLGVPGKVIRPLKQEELDFLPKSAAHYVQDSREYLGYVRGPSRLGTNDSDLESFYISEGS